MEGDGRNVVPWVFLRSIFAYGTSVIADCVVCVAMRARAHTGVMRAGKYLSINRLVTPKRNLMWTMAWMGTWSSHTLQSVCCVLPKECDAQSKVYVQGRRWQVQSAQERYKWRHSQVVIVIVEGCASVCRACRYAASLNAGMLPESETTLTMPHQ